MPIQRLKINSPFSEINLDPTQFTNFLQFQNVIYFTFGIEMKQDNIVGGPSYVRKIISQGNEMVYDLDTINNQNFFKKSVGGNSFISILGLSPCDDIVGNSNVNTLPKFSFNRNGFLTDNHGVLLKEHLFTDSDITYFRYRTFTPLTNSCNRLDMHAPNETMGICVRYKITPGYGKLINTEDIEFEIEYPNGATLKTGKIFNPEIHALSANQPCSNNVLTTRLCEDQSYQLNLISNDLVKCIIVDATVGPTPRGVTDPLPNVINEVVRGDSFHFTVTPFADNKIDVIWVERTSPNPNVLNSYFVPASEIPLNGPMTHTIPDIQTKHVIYVRFKEI